MSGISPIFIGDLARALATAGKDRPESWSAIASLLGFGREAPLPPPSPPIDTTSSTAGNPFQKLAEKQDSGLEQDTSGNETDIGNLIAFDYERSTESPQQIPTLSATEPERKPGPAPRLASLLDPAWERGILIAAVGRLINEGDIAIMETVDMIARGSTLADVPRELITSVAKGCQILIDRGAGMQPFARDARGLADSVRKAVGEQQTRIFTFVDCPTLGVMAEDYQETAYFPPENGGLVLALSDLCNGGAKGMIRDAEPEDWLVLAKRINDSGSRLVVFNPYPPERWTKAVANRVPVVYWDRATRTTDVRRILRRAWS